MLLNVPAQTSFCAISQPSLLVTEDVAVFVFGAVPCANWLTEWVSDWLKSAERLAKCYGKAFGTLTLYFVCHQVDVDVDGKVTTADTNYAYMHGWMVGWMQYLYPIYEYRYMWMFGSGVRCAWCWRLCWWLVVLRISRIFTIMVFFWQFFVFSSSSIFWH